MAESLVQVTEGSGKKLHTWSRTVGANTVEDEVTLPGEHFLATYSITSGSVALATANSHVLQIMAGASLYVRIRRIWITQGSNMTTAARAGFQLIRLTTAGSGGSAITPRPFDTGDAAAGFTAQTLPGVKGTEGVTLFERRINLLSALSTTATTGDQPFWEQNPFTKPIIIPTGAANGICLKYTGANDASGTLNVHVELVETSYL